MRVVASIIAAAVVLHGAVHWAAGATMAADPASTDWPQWGGTDPGRNMVSAETNLPDSFEPGRAAGRDRVAPVPGRNVRWRVPIGAHIYGTPTVAGGRIYVGTDGSGVAPGRFQSKPAGRVLCLDEQTGRLVWELNVPRSSPARLKGNFLSQEASAGICSSVAVDGDHAYVLTGNGLLLCLTAGGLAAGNQGPFRDEGRFLSGGGTNAVATLPTDADIVWIYDLVEDLHVSIHDVSSCSPLVHGAYIYLETSNGVTENHRTRLNPDAPSFIVIDKVTGRLVAADNEKIGQRLFHCLWSPPSLGTVDDRTLVFFGGGDGVCYAFAAPHAPAEASGATQRLEKVWSYDCNPPEYRTQNGHPVSYLDGDKRKGDKGPNRNDGSYAGPSEIIAGPVFWHNRVYVAIGQDPAHGRGRGMLHCIDAAQTGDISQTGCIWHFDQIERTLSGVAIADGRLFAADLAGHVFCLNADTGALYWTHDLRSETWGTPLVADGKVYIESVNGLHVLSAGAEPKELAHIRLDAPGYGSVVAAHGTLYVASDRTLWAVRRNDGIQKP